LRRETYRRAGHKCELCDQQDQQLEAHEVWEYDKAAGIQRLLRLISVCHACHEVQHFGLARMRGRGTAAQAHLAKVNGWDDATARRHIDEAFAVWKQRNKVAWTLDLAILADYGVSPPTTDELDAARALRKTQLHGGGGRFREASQ